MSEAMSARHVLLGAAWVAIGLITILLMYQRVLLVNRVPIPKPPDALADRAEDALATLGYDTAPRATATGMTVSRDYLSYVDRTSTALDRWKSIATLRPESIVFWYRTSPRVLIPWGRDNQVQGTNPPLNVSGMTLVVVDASGRLAEFHAVPEPIESSAPHGPTNWPVCSTRPHSTCAGSQRSRRGGFPLCLPTSGPPGRVDSRIVRT
jgi:hypothetical protein